jgi:uncharacterized protein (TIGR03067 family)
MTRYGISLLTIGLIFLAGQVFADDKADKDKIQGEWTLVTMEDNGESQKITEDSEHFIKLKIEGDKLLATIGGAEHNTTFVLDSSKKPKTIDVTIKGGDQDGTVMKGFYEMNGDTLKICIGSTEKPDRPAEFKSKDEVKVLTFKRAKK